ncbi:non-ribosomal peptide synthetase [Clostridium felsineum]|uniref:non-ribosomal peptide synthetase n=1 Tax=Clostridium felsineum TaxID=36839 RepID=UPI00098C7F20|nr:non-ribosomal peptide synthetase [Clostridium felsineum]
MKTIKRYNACMKAKNLSEQKEYWLNEFKEEVPVLDIPSDYIRPKEESFKEAMIFRKIEKQLGEKINSTAGKTGTTEYMIFLSAAMITLSKYSRQEDIVIGSLIRGRTHKHKDKHVNILAMRGRPKGNKEYIEFLQEIKESCIKAYENQEYPFEELIEELDIRRDMSRNPLFDVMLVFKNNEEIDYSLNDIRIEYANEKSKIAKLDLTFNIYEFNGKFEIGLEYCSDLFKEESAERILTHYVRILEQITENMERKINDIEIVTAEERTLILKTFNDTKAEYPKNKTVVDLFEEQVEKTPDNTALIFEDKQLTYSELNRKVNQLARKLRELGVKPDDFVAIMAERSIEMIVGIYGIIKAGGAYVPIDPNYPEDRIKYMLEDCTPKVILVYRADVKTKVPVINLEEKAVWEGETANLEKVNKPKNLAYCIYTSGTTGKPKGVMVEHKGIINMKSYYEDKVPISKEDKILQFANIVFDASVSEMTMAILIGGTLVIVPDSIRLDVQKVQKYVQKYKVTVATFPPNYYIQINDFEPRIIITAGSESSGKLIEKTENSKYINAYGPTENTVSATHWEYKNGEEIPKKIPIGKPISNVQIYILNNNSMCGIGISGELCIAGVGVARGYLNRPELTAEKFVDNPYGEGKLYRTGDLARWLPDGNIEYLGRIDEQVKIRGFRIELGEIESALRKIDRVKDAVVIVREDENKEKSINAYIVSDEEINVSEIREELEKNLPDYMIPAYMMQIENIPVTRNGKLDKKALPKIEVKSEKEYIAPRNDIEALICTIFSKVLNVKKVGINDDFFELGGHSLLAIKFEVEMNKYNFAFKVRDIFKYKTPYQIENYITGEEMDIKDLEEDVNIPEKVSIDCNDNCIDNIEPFNDIFYKNCYYNALFPVIKHYNKNILLFLINDVLVYDYNAEKAYIDIQYIGCNPMKDILYEEGIDICGKDISNDIIDDIIKAIKKESPVIITIDCYYSSIRQDTYKKIHWSHALLVYGFNLNTKKFNVIEHSHKDNLTYSKATMSFEDLQNSYLGYIKNFSKKEPTYFEIVNVKENKYNMIAKDELDKLQKKTLIKNILLKKEDLYKGLNELQKFVQMYSDVIINEKTIKEKVESYVEGINHIINAKYVEKYRIEHVLGKNTTYYKKIIEIIELWENVRIYLGRYMYSGKFIAENFKLSVEKMYKIIEKEKEFIEMFVDSIISI